MNLRLKNIYAKLDEKRLSALIISSAPNISYISGFRSDEAYLIISKEGNFYLTDSRYTGEAKQKLSKDFVLKKVNGSCFEIIAGILGELKVKRAGFEERNLAFAEYVKIKKTSAKNITFIPTHSLVEDLRRIKTEDELEKIRQAVKITIAALSFIKPILAPGRKEIEVAAELERFIRYKGANSAAFEIIVASGPNSSFPHHLASQRKLKNNEPVLIDVGVDYLGYKSDLTRTFFLGKIEPLFRKIYDIVKKAQDKALKQIKPGIGLSHLDKVARQHITKEGYGGFFSHNLGHGIGLEVHEEPHISGKNNQLLMPREVFTVEPAIYLPGKFGVRIEDMVLVTEKGARVLSGSFNKRN